MNMSADQDKPLVLIVDDEPANVQVLARTLQSDYQVRFTTRGDKAIELAESQKPDLILLDVVMPVMDGYEVCRQLKQSQISRDVPVIFVTAKGEEQFEAIGFEVGGVDYVTKPVNAFLLLARIKTHIELKRNNDYLKTLTSQDGLTGIANRRRLDEVLEQEWQRAVRQGHSRLSCIMMDVDYFKRFNDGYGHQAGDECLRQVAQTVKNNMVRKTDLAARYGGEEFVCILPETPLEGAVKFAEKIRQSIIALAMPHGYSEVADHVTVSIGVAVMEPVQGVAPAALMEAADRQLYRAKQDGRNRVCA